MTETDDALYVHYDWLAYALEPLGDAARTFFFARSRMSHAADEEMLDVERRLRALWDQGPHYTGRRVWAAEHDDRMHFFFGAKSEIEHLIALARQTGERP